MAFTIKILLDALHLIKRLVGFCFQVLAAADGNMSVIERRFSSQYCRCRISNDAKTVFQGQFKICFKSVRTVPALSLFSSSYQELVFRCSKKNKHIFGV